VAGVKRLSIINKVEIQSSWRILSEEKHKSQGASASIIDVIIKQLAQRLLKIGGIVGKIVNQFQNIQEDILHQFPDNKTSPKHPRIHRPHLTLYASTLGATPSIASSWVKYQMEYQHLVNQHLVIIETNLKGHSSVIIKSTLSALMIDYYASTTLRKQFHYPSMVTEVVVYNWYLIQVDQLEYPR